MIENREREKGRERKGERERWIDHATYWEKGIPLPFYLTVGLHFYVDILYMTIF